MKKLIRVPLTELRTYDEEILGSIYHHAGKEYAWQKNAGVTALVAKACCLQLVTSVVANANTRVVATDGAASTRAYIGLPAGVPMTAIACSGSATGDHGWVQVKGPCRVQLDAGYTAAVQVAGCMAIGEDARPTTQPWGTPYLNTATSALTANYYGRKVVLMADVASTGGIVTCVSACVDVQCR